jgi:hypothetical protein
MAAFAALIECDAIDIDTFAGQLAGKVDRARPFSETFRTFYKCYKLVWHGRA